MNRFEKLNHKARFAAGNEDAEIELVDWIVRRVGADGFYAAQDILLDRNCDTAYTALRERMAEMGCWE